MFLPTRFFALSLIFSPVYGFCQTAPPESGELQRHMQNAQREMRRQRPDLAVPEFEAALVIDPHNTDAQANLGVLLYFGGEYARAVPHLRAAVQEQAGLWKIQALLGLAEERMQDTMTARNDLEAALPNLKGEKVQTEVGDALISIYTSAGELEKAARTVSILLESRPTDTRLLLLSYRLHSDLANSSLLTMAIAAPHSAEMHQAMARELARHGDEAAAVANYRQAIQIDPKLPGLYFEFGSLLYSSTDERLRAEAESQFEAALATNPHEEKAQLMLGEIAARRGDTKAAYEADSRAVEMQPNDGDACVELAKILVSMNERDKARALLSHAIEIDPTDYTAHYRLSTLDRQQGRQDEAKHELAEYKKYKEMKAKLRAVFQEMRLKMDVKPEDDGGISK